MVLPENPAPRDTVNIPASDAPFRKMVDSTAMLSIARFVMPALGMSVLGVLGYLMAAQLTDIKTGQKEGLAELKASQLAGLNEVKDGQKQVWAQVSKIAESQSASVAIVSGLSVQVNNTSKQLDHLQTQVDSLPRK